MNIILQKDGKLYVNESPLQGKAADLENLAAFISNPSDGDAIVYDASAGIWKAGEVGGGGGGGGVTPLIATLDPTTYTLNKTFREIETAYNAGQPVYISYELNDGETELSGKVSVIGTEHIPGGFQVYAIIDSTVTDLFTDSEDGYPAIGG